MFVIVHDNTSYAW